MFWALLSVVAPAARADGPDCKTPAKLLDLRFYPGRITLWGAQWVHGQAVLCLRRGPPNGLTTYARVGAAYTGFSWWRQMARVVGQANGATRLATPEPKRRYSNGKALAKHFTNLPNVRPSTVVAQRFQTITSALLSDQGGEQCTEARRQLVRRFAAACVLAESMEAKLADGKQIDVPEFGLVASSWSA